MLELIEMAFTKALYYPHIEIEDDGWLKTAFLYWDEIQTIVPASMDEPYRTKTSCELYHAGALSPLHVHPGMTGIRKLAGRVLDYLGSHEAEGLLIGDSLEHSEYIHPEKLPAFDELAHIHPEKLPDLVRRKLEQISANREGEWLRVDRGFAEFYMTLLATELADNVGLGLLTDLPAGDRLSTAVRLEGRIIPNLRMPDPYYRRYHRDYFEAGMMPHTLSQALLADLTIQRISISPETPVESILKFKADHASELGRFRTKLAELTKGVEGELSVEAIRQRVHDTYENEVKPAIGDLKESLSGSKLKWSADSFVKMSLLSVGAGSALVNFGLSIPQALLAGAGISLTASAVLYNCARREEIRRNPFSYVLAAERQFAG
jgi:hypothetical protein